MFVLGWAYGNMRYVSKRAMVNHEAGKSFILKCMLKKDYAGEDTDLMSRAVSNLGECFRQNPKSHI